MKNMVPLELMCAAVEVTNAKNTRNTFQCMILFSFCIASENSETVIKHLIINHFTPNYSYFHFPYINLKLNLLGEKKNRWENW